jgi:sentrin-specific protease 1
VQLDQELLTSARGKLERWKEFVCEEDGGMTKDGKEGDVIISKFNAQITERQFVCLRPETWLNDQVINFYMYMLNLYDQHMRERCKGRTKSHFFNSFFIERLLRTRNKYTFANVEKWTKSLPSIFDLDKIVFPINRNFHWTLACVYLKEKEIHYFDSLTESCKSECTVYDDFEMMTEGMTKGTFYMNGLLRWIQDEGEKNNIIVNKEEWTLIDHGNDFPQQSNNYDCGLYAIVCADHLSDNLPVTGEFSSFSAANMPFWREKIAVDMLRGNLTYLYSYCSLE